MSEHNDRQREAVARALDALDAARLRESLAWSRAWSMAADPSTVEWPPRDVTNVERAAAAVAALNHDLRDIAHNLIAAGATGRVQVATRSQLSVTSERVGQIVAKVQARHCTDDDGNEVPGLHPGEAWTAVYVTLAALNIEVTS